MKFDFVRIFHKIRDIGAKYVTYWYQISTCCEELVPILHNVKFKSEIAVQQSKTRMLSRRLIVELDIECSAECQLAIKSNIQTFDLPYIILARSFDACFGHMLHVVVYRPGEYIQN